MELGNMASSNLIQFETPLEASRLSIPYRSRLHRGLEVFSLWLGSSKWATCEWWRDGMLANRMLAEFVQCCFSQGLSFSVTKHAVLSVQTRYPHLRHPLSRPWNSLRSWQSRLPHRHRLPLPMELLQASFGAIVNQALGHPYGLALVTVGVLWRMAFFALLRPGEMLGLKRADLRFHLLPEGSWILIVGIKDPKNSNAMGRFQFCTIRDPGTVAWARYVFASLSPLAKLWPASKQRMQLIFNRVMKHLGADHTGFTLASFRPGGTSFMYLQNVEVSRIKFTGRWAAESSLISYIQETICHLVWSSLSDHVESTIRAQAQLSLFAWDSPPLKSKHSAPFGPWRLPRRRTRKRRS